MFMALAYVLTHVLWQDVHDLDDVLKTVSLMKWKPDKISELVSGYGELWSSRIMTASMEAMFPKSNLHYAYLDARKIIIVEEDEEDDFVIRWDLTQPKMDLYLEEVYEGMRAAGKDPLTTGIVIIATGKQGDAN